MSPVVQASIYVPELQDQLYKAVGIGFQVVTFIGTDKPGDFYSWGPYFLTNLLVFFE